MRSTFAILVLSLASPATSSQTQPRPLVTKHETSFVVFPADCNSNFPMLFGGKTLAEMDRCAAVTVRKLLWSSTVRDAVTVAISNVKFHKAGEVKDLLVIEGKVIATGTKSVTIAVTVSKETEAGREKIAEGEFVFVAYDTVNKVAVPHGITISKGTP